MSSEQQAADQRYCGDRKPQGEAQQGGRRRRAVLALPFQFPIGHEHAALLRTSVSVHEVRYPRHASCPTGSQFTTGLPGPTYGRVPDQHAGKAPGQTLWSRGCRQMMGRQHHRGAGTRPCRLDCRTVRAWCCSGRSGFSWAASDTGSVHVGIPLAGPCADWRRASSRSAVRRPVSELTFGRAGTGRVQATMAAAAFGRRTIRRAGRTAAGSAEAHEPSC